MSWSRKKIHRQFIALHFLILLEYEAKPLLTELIPFLKPQSHNWYEIGQECRVPYDYLQELDQKFSETNMRKQEVLECVLDRWLDNEVSWTKLIEILEGLKMHYEVYKIRNFLNEFDGMRD